MWDHACAVGTHIDFEEDLRGDGGVLLEEDDGGELSGMIDH